jgi:hypothetical protein
MTHLINLEQKKIRAQVIALYLRAHGSNRCVCLTCGNAAKALREEGVQVIEVGKNGPIDANTWLTFQEIAAIWPDTFDATSGHLPWPIMQRIAYNMPDVIMRDNQPLYLPTGSGETLVCLKLHNPHTRIVAVYNLDASTTYNPGAPLNALVALLADDVIMHPGDRVLKELQ